MSKHGEPQSQMGHSMTVTMFRHIFYSTRRIKEQPRIVETAGNIDSNAPIGMDCKAKLDTSLLITSFL
ncbi:hypothetical protein P8C59_000914 [Phyllachora maydis]|uniref:Uncharacterized protein n=1 Tax=Phyllachora maydis TaxID=1825666 RepID=A0AAD9M9I0_9PEZI|nr:hypothetical protein P8C59_000914 [Phyllachora maydis]